MIVQSICHNVMLFNDYTDEYQSAKDDKTTFEDVDTRIAKKKHNLPVISEDDDEWHATHKAISINGYWYDVTNFISSHPGGNVIERFLRCDATSAFYGMHQMPDNILKKRFPCAIHKTDKPYMEKYKKVNATYWNLYQRYLKLGFFTPSQFWLHKTQILNACLGVLAFYVSYNYPQNWLVNGIIAGQFILGAAFLTHDACHHYVSLDHKFDDRIAWFWGDVIFGVSSRWWREEHNDHHGIPNVYSESEQNIIDPQANEDFWSQSDKVL